MRIKLVYFDAEICKGPTMALINKMKKRKRDDDKSEYFFIRNIQCI